MLNKPAVHGSKQAPHVSRVAHNKTDECLMQWNNASSLHVSHRPFFLSRVQLKGLSKTTADQ
jgi:hypothetical protein